MILAELLTAASAKVEAEMAAARREAAAGQAEAAAARRQLVDQVGLAVWAPATKAKKSGERRPSCLRSKGIPLNICSLVCSALHTHAFPSRLRSSGACSRRRWHVPRRRSVRSCGDRRSSWPPPMQVSRVLVAPSQAGWLVVRENRPQHTCMWLSLPAPEENL